MNLALQKSSPIYIFPAQSQSLPVASIVSSSARQSSSSTNEVGWQTATPVVGVAARNPLLKSIIFLSTLATKSLRSNSFNFEHVHPFSCQASAVQWSCSGSWRRRPRCRNRQTDNDKRERNTIALQCTTAIIIIIMITLLSGQALWRRRRSRRQTDAVRCCKKVQISLWNINKCNNGVHQRKLLRMQQREIKQERRMAW